MEQETSTQRLLGFDPRSIFKDGSGFRVGEGDLIVGGDCAQVLGRMAACFLGCRNAEGRRWFRGITVVAPPRLVWDYADEAIHAMIVAGVEDLQGFPIKEDLIESLLAGVNIHRCHRLDANEVVAAVVAASERQIILIPESSKYRVPEMRQEWALGYSGTLLHEDTWVPHTARMAESCLAAAGSNGGVVVFSIAKEPLIKQSNLKLLCDVEGLYPAVLGAEGATDNMGLLTRMMPRWLALAAGGRSKEALDELDRADLGADAKRQVELQVSARAGDRSRVLAILHEYLAEMDKVPLDAMAFLGRVAYKFGDNGAAIQFFSVGLDELTDQKWLEASLMALTLMGAADLVHQCWNRLYALFPSSSVLEEDREVRLFQISKETSGSAKISQSRAGFEELHSFVANALHNKTIVDYESLVDQVRSRWPEGVPLTATCAALHALERHAIAPAVKMAIIASSDSRYEPQAVRVVLGALRRMFLLETRSGTDIQVYWPPLDFITRYLASHPDEADLRMGLGQTLSVEAAGSVGLPILASFAVDTAGRNAQIQELPLLIIKPADRRKFKSFFAKAIRWMREQPAIELGVTRIPVEIAGSDAASYIVSLEASMRHGAQSYDTPEALALLESTAYLICLLYVCAPIGYADIDALRLLAAKFSMLGQPQRARDIADQILNLAGSSAGRQRVAWGGYADIYQRTHGSANSLIALICAAQTGEPIDTVHLFHETYILLRVTRDLRLYEIAKSILPTCRHLCESLGEDTLGQQRLDGVEIALDVGQSSKLDEQGLFSLLDRTREHCEIVMRSGDEITPAAGQFLQIAGEVERTGLMLPDEAVALRERLAITVGKETTAYLRGVSAAFPTAEEVVWLHNRLGMASNAENAASDQTAVVIAAHRLLLPRKPDISIQHAAVAIELLCDHSVDSFNLPQAMDVSWPAGFIKGLSEGGLSVLMLAVDSSGELVAVLADAGELRLFRPPAGDIGFKRRLNAWGVKYPYQYGMIEREDGNAEYYSSMSEFEIALPNTDKVLVVAQPAIQSLPYNLLLINGEFAGSLKAIGSVPSLTWLESARKRSSASTERRHAWISCSLESDAYGTLDMVFSRLEPVLIQYGFKIDTKARIPMDLNEATMVVVTAHGQLASGRRYIHRIADDHELIESPSLLARALAGVEVVILFVCSGGRVDPHPWANTTVSLPKMLLDRGCRVVIGSPWPLAAVVPGNWLERFLEAWNTGDTVLEANFKANNFVRQQLGPEPGLSLAMTVYGDVLMTKNKSQK